MRTSIEYIRSGISRRCCSAIVRNVINGSCFFY
jgi:hypothetical protein